MLPSRSRRRAGSGRLLAAFESRVVPAHEATRDFALDVEPAALIVRGTVSAGQRGWQLSATVMCRRRRLVVQVVARARCEDLLPDIEEHEYEARVAVTGTYAVFVTHVFHTVGQPAALPEPRFLGDVTVPAGEEPGRAAPPAGEVHAGPTRPRR